MEGVVGAQERAQLSACFGCLLAFQRQLVDDFFWPNLSVSLCRELHTMIWGCLVDLSIF